MGADDDGTRAVTVEQRVRPLRLAFLVERDNRKQTLQALYACNRIWGGALCPIVPVYRRRPQWASPYFNDVTNGWIASFEPDALIETSQGLAGITDHSSIPTTPLADIEKSFLPSQVATTVWRAYATAYEEVYRFSQRHPEEAILCDPATRADTLWVAAMFGSLPASAAGHELRELYKHTFDPSCRVIGGLNFTELMFRRPPTTPLAATLYGVNLNRPAGDQILIYYLFEPNRVIDVLHLWSLRAYGLRVYPLPLPYVKHFASALKGAIGKGYMANATLRIPMTISPAPSVSRADAERAAAELGDATSAHPLLNPEVGRTLPIWDTEDLRRRRLRRMTAEAGEVTSEVMMRNGRISFSPAQPPFRGSAPIERPAGWAVAVQVRDSRLHSELAEAFPPDLLDATELLEVIGPGNDVTSTSEGLIARSERGRQHFWSLPTGTELFCHWLLARGITAEVSAAGKTTEEFIRALGGPAVAINVGAPDLIKLIGKAAATPGGGVIGFSDLQRILGKLHQGNQGAMQRHAAFLTRAGVLQPQMAALCPICSVKNWYSPAELDNKLSCRRCLRTFLFPSAPPPRTRDWGYRPTGPFATPDYAHGSYTIALALRFFSHLAPVGGRLSWTTSLLGKRGGDEFELDFGLWETNSYWDDLPELVLGEAKTFNTFDHADFRRANRLLQRFPEAKMTFATMRASLSESEQASIRALATRGSKERNRGRVIVLTATELADRHIMPAYRWKQLGGRYAEVAARHEHLRGLNVLSDATLDMYTHLQWASPPVLRV